MIEFAIIGAVLYLMYKGAEFVWKTLAAIIYGVALVVLLILKLVAVVIKTGGRLFHRALKRNLVMTIGLTGLVIVLVPVML